MRGRAATQRWRGQALVEFAFAMPLVIMLILLAMEGGRLVFTWVVLSEASREATRTAILPSSTTVTAVKNRARDLGNVVGLTNAEITVSHNGTAVPTSPGTFDATRGDIMRVRISHVYTSMIGYATRDDWPRLPFTTWTIVTQTEMRAEG